MPTESPTAIPTIQTVRLSPTELARFGVAGPLEYVPDIAAAGLPFGTTLNWRVNPELSVPDGIVYWQMLRLSDEGVFPDWDYVETILDAWPEFCLAHWE
ncbi:MAG: hypothetical protein R3C44_13645 [Chloroflexota bacterium]